MTSGTVEFRQTEYELNDTLIVDFTWFDAKWNFTGENYATLSIYDPTEQHRISYVEVNDSEGSQDLSFTADKLGTWRARLRIWNGSGWTDLSHYTEVGEEAPPPPPPPPPPEDFHNWRFNTVPGNCSITIEGYGSGTSSSTGYYIFPDVPEGVYNWSVSKTGYVTKSGQHDLTGSKVSIVALEIEPEPPELYTLIVNTIPTNCRVQVNDYWDTNSGDDGTVGIPGLIEGSYNVTISRDEFETRTAVINIPETLEITANITTPPEFWLNPLEYIQYFVITTMDTLLEWEGGTFIEFLNTVKDFFDNSWSGISAFFSDVSQGVKDALGSTLTNIQDWLDNTFNNVGEWWDSTVSGIGEWWNSTTGEVGDWWTSLTGDIGDWWTGFWDDPVGVIQGAVEGVVNFGADQLLIIWEGIQGWVIDLITGLIESFTAGFDQGIEDQKNEREGEDWIGGK